MMRGMAEKRSWSDLPARSKVLIVIASLVEIVVTGVALRDIKERPASSVRGPKLLWAAVCFVQPVGPVSYLVCGRRRGN